MNYCTPEDIVRKLDYINPYGCSMPIFEIKGEPRSFGTIKFTWLENKSWQEVNIYIPSSGKEEIRKNVRKALENFNEIICNMICYN